MSDLDRICVECGDDLVCEGYDYCSDCLDRLFSRSEP